MKFLYYLRYFFYIAFNWNLKLALFTLWHEIRGEKKYGIDTTRMDDLKKFSIKPADRQHAEQYQGSNYFLLENLFSYLQDMNENNNIVDYGCGKGRALVVAASHGFNKMTGVELAAGLCDIAKKNVQPWQLRFPEKSFTIIHSNALDHIIENDTNVFFFFNPFDEVIMLGVVKNILRSLKATPREVYVIYINPVHKEIFLSAGFVEIYHIQKMHYANGSVLKREIEEEF